MFIDLHRGTCLFSYFVLATLCFDLHRVFLVVPATLYLIDLLFVFSVLHKRACLFSLGVLSMFWKSNLV
jgi:hypothetical protein